MFGENTPMRAVAIVTLFVHHILMKKYSQPSHLIYTIHKLDSSFFTAKPPYSTSVATKLEVSQSLPLAEVITRI